MGKHTRRKFNYTPKHTRDKAKNSDEETETFQPDLAKHRKFSKAQSKGLFSFSLRTLLIILILIVVFWQILKQYE